ncbi:NADP-dependent malic enzyme [Clostridium tarantellae]|uniref:NAD-dependent malic enzyme n=1 Tax=Clostridium tarantellae TaxID=39493 RepID=A0A6I1MNT2_9CLOT|nr:NAD-dependent malic enzyme [Clostridium tarantellae]
MNYFEESLKLHEKNHGKLSVISKFKVESRDDLSIAYSPGVAEPCREINSNKENVYKYTSKGNLVAVVTDGSAVLGLGNIGPEAALPVMEGKAILFKEFGGVDAFPICIDSNDVDTIVNTVKLIAPTFGGINLEDISAPRCFEIEEKLKKELDIPVFHDDQHGTAIVVLAGVINSLKLVNKNISNIKIVVNGIGAAGTAITKLLMSAGATNIVLCDKVGILSDDIEEIDYAKKALAKEVNTERVKGTLKDALVGADIFIGVSAPNLLTSEMVSTMNNDSIIFAMANPNPEIMPDDAKKGGARIIGTGRSDLPNQINNVSVFPGLFKGALRVRAKIINEEMKLAAAMAIANAIPKEQLNDENIIPCSLDRKLVDIVADAVENAAISTKVARITK